ncbi:hypothetical protein [Shewanella sp. CG12_big_fil_rev_8_21_14_0_65_47_15]|uniref:hypothetical protein n=1 Tax=Shewanella sp. CG12_big_fil_rev_8_21_14_0_65_47_15 TaxID=1975537 RepID=UPI0025CF3EAA|nr:hypothetical protein [Shewanella sp. CG12_big_fil_rev_8_21_14_0_65_47_15]
MDNPVADREYATDPSRTHHDGAVHDGTAHNGAVSTDLSIANGALIALLPPASPGFDARQLIKALGKGIKGSRTLQLNEARQLIVAFAAKRVSSAQMASAMVLMRARGETAAEVAGITLGLRDIIATDWRQLDVDVDWPVYAGKRGQLPWLLLAAKALAADGVRIMLHGDNLSLPHRCHVADCLAALDITVAHTPEQVKVALESHHLVYVAVDSFLPVMASCRALHQELGLRSLLQMAVRCVNPTNAKSGLRSYFHSGLDKHYAAIGELMCANSPSCVSTLAIFKGVQGEAEWNPRVSTQVTMLGANLSTCEPGAVVEDDKNVGRYQLEIPTLVAAALGINGANHTDMAELSTAWEGENPPNERPQQGLSRANTYRDNTSRDSASRGNVSCDSANYWSVIGTILLVKLALRDSPLLKDSGHTMAASVQPGASAECDAALVEAITQAEDLWRQRHLSSPLTRQCQVLTEESIPQEVA